MPPNTWNRIEIKCHDLRTSIHMPSPPRQPRQPQQPQHPQHPQQPKRHQQRQRRYRMPHRYVNHAVLNTISANFQHVSRQLTIVPLRRLQECRRPNGRQSILLLDERGRHREYMQKHGAACFSSCLYHEQDDTTGLPSLSSSKDGQGRCS